MFVLRSKYYRIAMRAIARQDAGQHDCLMRAALTMTLLLFAQELFAQSTAPHKQIATLGLPVARQQVEMLSHSQQPSQDIHPLRAMPVTVQTGSQINGQTHADVPGSLTAAVDAAFATDCSSVYPPPLAPWAHNFSPTPLPDAAFIYDAAETRRPYDEKTPIPVQRPLIELGRPLYLNGIIPPSSTCLGETNLLQQHFYVYGDHRIGFGAGNNAAGEFRNIAQQLRLDLDWGITSTERVHAFVQPFDRNGNFTGINFVNDQFDPQSNYNVDFLTAFFEGDLGAITGGLTDTWYPFDLPFTAGLIPLLYQNGIWMEDAVTGAAFALPSKNSRTLKWSNFDATFFAAVDQINSDAFAGDNNAAQLLGTAWFIEAYEGYIETGYAYVHDRASSDRSYHNMTISFARRYFWKVANTVRVIANVGQDLPREQRTADGALLLLENAWVSHDTLRYVPYLNLFAGFGNPQSVARAGIAGGILRNTGINFESDLLNGYPTLDATANNTYGGAVGINLLGPELNHQFVLEAALLGVMENADDRRAAGKQAAVGMRYQLPLSYRTLIRMDTMYGWRDNDDDLIGGRIEYRWKF